MTNEEFMIELEKSFLRSKKVLLGKAKEYSPETGDDRLQQFYRAAFAQNVQPTFALIGMMTKHFTSICDMAAEPWKYSMKQWREKVTDLRNYTFLLDALLVDMNDKDFLYEREGDR